MSPPPDQDWLRRLVKELEQIERPSASDGERQAAEWVVGKVRRSRRRGADRGRARARNLLVAARGRRDAGRRSAASPRSAAGASSGPCSERSAPAGSPPTSRPASGRCGGCCRGAPPTTSSARSAPADAERTVVIVAHHDAAHPGIVFHPALPRLADRLGLIESLDTSPPLMAPVLAGPVMAALGALLGSRLLSRLAVLFGLGTAAAMTDIGLRGVVPGANDNGSGVVTLLAVAKRLIEEPPRSVQGDPPLGRRRGVLQRGDQGVRRAPFRRAPAREHLLPLRRPGRVRPHLLVLRGEGFLKIHEYPPRALALMDGVAEELGIRLYPNLRTHNGTDGLEPLAAGYETASLCGCNDLKQPGNYHWPNDTSEHVEFGSMADATRLTEAAVRRLDERWL